MANTTNTVANSTTAVGNYTANNDSNLPYLRAQPIGFTATGLRPNTRMSIFFDKVNVTAYCSPATYDTTIITPTSKDYHATGIQGSPIMTDANGTVNGIFYVPRWSFFIGNREFKLFNWINSQDDYVERISDSTCSATFIFRSFNYSPIDGDDSAIVTTRPSGTTNDGTTTNRGSGTPTNADPNNPRFDPMAQSFYVGSDMTQGQDGVFLKSIDLFFDTKSATQPISIDIRTMENGIPTTKILPFSSVTIPSSAVNADITGITATTFVFDTPVYVRSGFEYAISVIPGGQSPDYQIWTAIVGHNDSRNGAVNSNWGQGVLLTSSTGTTWTPIQNQYLKFNINRVDFSQYANGGIATMVNDDYEFMSYAKMSTVPFTIGEYVYQQPTALPGFVTVNTTSNTLTYNSAASGTLSCNLAANFAVNDHILVIGTLPTSDANKRFNYNIFANAVTLKITTVNPGNLTFVHANGAAITGATFANGAAYFFKPLKGTVSITAGSATLTGTGTRFDVDINTNDRDGTNRIPLILRWGNNSAAGHHVLFPNAVANATSATVRNPPPATNNYSFPMVAPTGRIIGIDYNRQLIILDRSTANGASGVSAWQNTFSSPSYFAAGRVLIGTDSGATAIIAGIHDMTINSLQLNPYQTAIQGTDISYSANLISKSYSEVDYPVISSSDTTYLSNAEIVIASKSNEITNFAGAKSFKIYANLSSQSSLLSPTIDHSHINIITKTNIISDFASDEDTNNGSALSKSIHFPVVLAQGLDAEDLSVYVTAYKPANTDIQIWAKLLNSADPETFNDVAWTPLAMITDATLVSDSANQDDYREFQYALNVDPLTNDMANDTVTSNNSAVIISTNSNTVWQSIFTNNQLVVLWSDANKTSYEVHQISSIDSNNQITFTSPVTLTNTSSAFMGSMPFPYSGYKNSLNNNIARYYTADGVAHDSFLTFALKIVMTADNNYLVPKVADIRAIALSV